MAGYTVQNLKQIDNAGAAFGLPEDQIELRLGRGPLGCETAGVSYMKLGPGYRAPFGHSHGEQEEIYVLVSGSARMKIGDDMVDLQPFTAVRVAPASMRGYEGGPQGAELIVVGAPQPSSPDGDGNVEPGWWTD